MKHFTVVKLCLLLIFGLHSIILIAQDSHFEKGQAFYAKRAELLNDKFADKRNINEAIKSLKKSNAKDACVALLKAYEFKGSYTKLSNLRKKRIFKKALIFGKESMAKYPNEVGIQFYYMANLGRWGQKVSVLKAHKKGVTDEIRSIAKNIIDQQPEYAEAGGMRILGAMHLKIPSVLFVMTWPSKDEALELLSNAYKISPENPANMKLYSEALIEKGNEEEAEKLLLSLMGREPRKEKLIEDIWVLKEAKEVYQSNF